jgi:drug/metabolite transporter (DMT)-like permease
MTDTSHYAETSRGPAIYSLAKVLFATMAIAVRFMPDHLLAFLLAFHVCAAIFFTIRARRDIRSVIRSASMRWIVISAVALLAGDISYFAAVKIASLDVGVSALTRWTAPVFVVLFSFIASERPTARSIIAALVCCIGHAVILFGGRDITASIFVVRGIMFAFVSAISVALFWLTVKIALKSASAQAVLALRSLISLPILGIAIAAGAFGSSFPAPERIAPLLVFGVVYGIIAGFLDVRGLQEAPVNVSAPLGYIVPVVTVLLAIILFQEPVTFAKIFGGALVLGGGYLALTRRVQTPLRA